MDFDVDPGVIHTPYVNQCQGAVQWKPVTFRKRLRRAGRVSRLFKVSAKITQCQATITTHGMVEINVTVGSSMVAFYATQCMGIRLSTLLISIST